MPRRWSSLPLCVVLVAILLPLAGCGYRNLLAAPQEPAESSARTSLSASTGPIRIAVLALRTQSPEPWLDREVGDALRREFGLRGRFKLINDPARADYVLRGQIRPVELASNSFSSFVVALEYRMTLSLDLELLRASGDIIRLSPRALTESDVYLASPDIEVNRTNRREAVRHLSDVIAVRVADSVEWIATPSESAPPEWTSEADLAGEAAAREGACEAAEEEGLER